MSRKDSSVKAVKSTRRIAASNSVKKDGKQIAALKQRADELAALQATVLDISSPRPLPELLNLIMERSCNLLHASSGGIYLSDVGKQLVNCVVSYKTERDFTGTILKYGEGAAGTVAQSGKPLIIDDYRTWSGRAKVYDQTQSFSAVMAVPLTWQGVVTGVIDVIRSENLTPFSQEDLELLNLFAAHAALAVENARLYGVLEQDLNQRKQAEEASRKNEQKYRLLFENLTAGFALHEMIYDEQGRPCDYRYLEINPAFEKLTGIPAPALLGKTVKEVLPGTEQYWIDVFGKVAQTGQPISYQNFSKELGRYYDTWVFCPTKDQFAVVFTDITERKLAEDALTSSEAELRALFVSMQDVVLVIDRDGVYRKIAPTNPELLYKPPQEMLGKHLWDILPAEQADTFYSAVQQVLKTQQPTRIEYELPIGGHQTWFAASISPMDDANTLWVARNITERKQSEQALQESEKLYRQAIEVAGAVPYYESYYDNGTRINYEFIGEGIRKITGYGPEEFTAALWDSLTLEIHLVEDLAGYSVDEAIQRVRSGKSPIWKCEHRIRTRNGEVRWVFEAAVELRDENGVSHGSIGTFQDITERKQAEQMQAALYEIANVAQTTSSLNDLFASIHKTLGTLMPAENFYIAIYDAQNDLLSFPYFVDQYDEPPLPQKFGKGLTEYVLRTRLPLLATPQVFEEMIEKKQVDLLGIPSIDWIGVPLTVGDETFGVIVIQTYTGEIRLTQKDLELLTFVSTQAAMAIKRKQAEESLRQRTSQLESLRQISLELIAELDVDKLLHSITVHALELLNFTGGGIYLYRPELNKLEWVVAIDTQSTPLGTMLDYGEGLSGKVWQQRKLIVVDDYEHWEGRAALFDSKAFKTVVGVPIIKEDEFLGVLVLLADFTGSFNMQNASLLELFAGYAAVAVHNARLYQDAHQRLTELEVLYKTSNALSAEHDLNTLLRSIVESARKLLNTATSGMYLTVPESDELELSMDTTPYVPLGSRIRFGEGVAGRVAKTRQPLRIDDYSTWEGHSKLYEGMPIRAVLEVPMLYRGELIGVLTADEAGESKRKYTENDERLLSLFASQAAGAIHSARLYNEIRRRAQEFAGLYETTRDLSMQLDLSTVMTKIIERATKLLNVFSSSIYLFNAAQADLELVASIGPDLPLGTHRQLGDGLAGRVAQSGTSMIVEDYQSWELRSKLFEGLPYGSMMGVPLIYGGHLLGVLDVAEIKPSTRIFDEADLRLLSLFAGQAASAIENAKLFDSLQSSNEDLTLAYDATIEGWSRAMDLRDKETEGHTLRVTELALSLARAMGIDESELTHMRRGGLLHDIGKLGIPDNILLKAEDLTDEEWQIMRRHPTYAYEMLLQIDYLKPALNIPYCHHEKWDGTGYPRRLKGEQIPLVSRLFAIADVWDALRSDRPYRAGWTIEKTREYILEQSGKHFDPRAVEIFITLLDELPAVK